MRVTFSQLTCLYQLALVMAVSVMWTFLGSYDLFRFGSVDFAIGEGCEERYSGLTARWPAAGCEEGMMS